jgi:signal peptidase I
MEITPLHYPEQPHLPQLPPEPELPSKGSGSDGPPEPQNEGLRSIASTLLILIAAPLIALALTAFVFQSYEVDGPSMETTLDNRDRLIVLKAPVTVAKLSRDPYIPERGEIIVFTKPGTLQFGEDGEKQLIKRVIGLPGERVVVNDGSVTVFNSEHPEGFQPDRTLPYGDIIGRTPGRVDITLPPNEVFVMGDNRTNSLDSRAFGSVESKDIVGTLAMRILPLSKAQRF